MSEGKTERIARHFKETLRHLDYAQQRAVLWELASWKNRHVRPPERMRLSHAERIRFKHWLWWKHGPVCAYCQRFYVEWRQCLTLDHIHPVSKGGAMRDIQNMALACRECNERKGNAWV